MEVATLLRVAPRRPSATRCCYRISALFCSNYPRRTQWYHAGGLAVVPLLWWNPVGVAGRLGISPDLVTSRSPTLITGHKPASFIARSPRTCLISATQQWMGGEDIPTSQLVYLLLCDMLYLSLLLSLSTRLGARDVSAMVACPDCPFLRSVMLSVGQIMSMYPSQKHRKFLMRCIEASERLRYDWRYLY